MTDEHRGEPRVPLKLKVAVVYHQHQDEATRPTYHGVTNEISMKGVSVVVDYNVFCADEVTLLLAIPPEHQGDRKKVVEVTARMVYTVHSSDHSAFRIGMRFRVFKADGEEILRACIGRRALKS